MTSEVLIVEDEVSLLELIQLNLESEGYTCTASTNGQQALELIRKKNFDLILLDVMLPGMNGFEIACVLSEEKIQIPVIFLTARSDDGDKIKGLRSGAVDYISKPFNIEELLLRVGIHIKKNTKSQNDVICIGDFEVNPLTFELTNKGKFVQEIGRKEVQLLELLYNEAGKVVSRELILNRIWGSEADTTTRTIDNYILALRKLFHDDPKNPRFFHSIRGIGYKLTP